MSRWQMPWRNNRNLMAHRKAASLGRHSRDHLGSLTLSPQLEDVVRSLNWLLLRSVKSMQKSPLHTHSFQLLWRNLARWMSLHIFSLKTLAKESPTLLVTAAKYLSFSSGCQSPSSASMRSGDIRSARRFGLLAMLHLFLDFFVFNPWNLLHYEGYKNTNSNNHSVSNKPF